MTYIISNVPFWCIFAIISFALVSFYFLINLIIRIFIPWFIQNEQQGCIASGLISTISIFYGILLGSMIITLWQNFNKIQITVSEEASQLAMIVRIAPALPFLQEKIKQQVGQYVIAVRKDEWNTMQLGKSSLKAEEAITQLYNLIIAYQPQTHEKIFYTEILSRLNDVLKARRHRLDTIAYPTPTLIIIILFLGAITLIVFLPTIGGFSSVSYQYFLNIALCLLIAFNLSVIIVLDHPFSGNWIISNQAFRLGILAQFKSSGLLK